MSKNINYANFLSSLRIIFTPVLVIIFFLSDQSPRIILISIFTVACLTDYLDGYVARRMNQVSTLGKFLDPVADKLLMIGSITAIWLNQVVPLSVFIIFVLRDLRWFLLICFSDWAWCLWRLTYLLSIQPLIIKD